MKNSDKLLIEELSKMPSMVIETAYLYALNYTLYGEDITEKWVTAIQNASALEKAYERGYYDALQRQAEAMCKEKIRELNKRKKELENRLNMSVQNSIEDEMNMCCTPLKIKESEER